MAHACEPNLQGIFLCALVHLARRSEAYHKCKVSPDPHHLTLLVGYFKGVCLHQAAAKTEARMVICQET